MQILSKFTYYKDSSKTKPLKLLIQRLFLYFITVILSTSLASCNQLPTTATQPNTYNYPISPDENNNNYMQIQLLGSLALKPLIIDSLPVYELSGLAWDEDENSLYAISDEGLLYHIKIELKENKLQSFNIISATHLTNKNGLALHGKYRDAEGLSLTNSNNGKKGDTELIISFEGKPRIAQYSTQGKFIAHIKTPENINNRTYFRHSNKALESVTYHPDYGVITASEIPLKNHLISKQTLYSTSGKEWHFNASKADNSSITGLDILPNGDILILERAYKNLFIPIVINLRRLKLDQCDNNNHCETETIASFSSADGWLLDNFEGLAHFRGNQYFMVSDNNKSFFQKTILVLFEVLEQQKYSHQKSSKKN